MRIINLVLLALNVLAFQHLHMIQLDISKKLDNDSIHANQEIFIIWIKRSTCCSGIFFPRTIHEKH
ncbi:hypothetical protein GcM1_c16362o49 [Golovinomyces cichoracearum]|uniref:Uncharacterized protein n=1 Tax=Golovinomyces cichoracearum TaxID=62708 RepID=A0A420IJL0_9PEZI|nr:hypothetical protein GcM1_c16362o49 [Golovinomyces cichoracearum]